MYVGEGRNLGQLFWFSEENWAELFSIWVFYMFCHKNMRELVRFEEFMTGFSQNFNIPLKSISIQLCEPVTIGWCGCSLNILKFYKALLINIWNCTCKDTVKICLFCPLNGILECHELSFPVMKLFSRIFH